MLLALWLERKFSKTQILELYLNRVYFGSGAYGIEQASQRYFGKPAKRYDSAGSGVARRPGASRRRGLRRRAISTAPSKRAQIVLAAMAELDFITPASEKVALAHPPHVVAQAGGGAINYVADWVMDAVNDVLGHIDEDIVVRPRSTRACRRAPSRRSPRNWRRRATRTASARARWWR